MIGLGTQDSFSQAEDFVDRHAITFPTVWDESFESWEFYGIASQPAYVLLDSSGSIVEASYGTVPADVGSRL